jgi:WbqC-like protein family
MTNMQSGALLSSAYLPPIQYLTKIISYSELFIEHSESYLKQSYRNRAILLSANGTLQLTLPIVNGPRAKGPIKEQQLSYDYPWQQMHWRGIVSAYNNSPYFEYYADDLIPYFQNKRWKYLVDFNSEILDTLIGLLKITSAIKYTDNYFPIGELPANIADFRYSIHPKNQKKSHDDCFNPQPYIQVFQEKWGFIPNLSIVDLLFNEGPESLMNLRSSIPSI